MTITEKQRMNLAMGRAKGIKRNRPKGLKYVLVKKNPTVFKKGHKPWHAGKFIKKDEEYSDNYTSIHSWVEARLGRPRICSECGTEEARLYDWANKSGKYKHNIRDWIRLCRRCHIKHDYEVFGARKEFLKNGIS